MLIIKASFVVAILSSVLFLEADCAITVRINQRWSELDPKVWSYGTSFSAVHGQQDIAYPESTDRCLVLFANKVGHMYARNVAEATVTYVLHEDTTNLATAETNIFPGDVHELMAKNVSIYIKKRK